MSDRTNRERKSGGRAGRNSAHDRLLSAFLVFILFLSLGEFGFPGADVRAASPASAPAISHQPGNATFARSATLRLYVNASSVDGGYLTYQWYRSAMYGSPVAGQGGDGGLTDGQKDTIAAGAAAIPDAADATLTVTSPAAEGFYYYWCEITNHLDIDGDSRADGADETAAIRSAFAAAKIISRASKAAAEKYDTYQYLYPSLQNGDFSILNQTAGLAVDIVADGTGFPGYGWQTTHYHATPGGRDIEVRGNANLTDVYPTNAYTGYGFREQDELLPSQHGVFCELSAFAYSSIFQEISTVPGKIYEWSIDHITRPPYPDASGNNPDVLAVVVGASINEAADYGSTVSYYNKDSASTDIGAAATTIPKGGPYVYGVNQYSYFNAIVNQVMTENGITAGTSASTNPDHYFGALFNSVDRSYTTSYNGSVYYVFLSSATRDTAEVTVNGSRWRHRSGVYTVPAGQGTSVFAFVNIHSTNPGSGNVLDNIAFDTGSPVNPGTDITYTADTSLSAYTKEGYAYGLAEVRGSSVIRLAGLDAYYNSSAASPDSALGAGCWYDGFGDGGLIEFKSLTPGKTYRIIGIPAKAVNPGLHTNESVNNVLDEGYYLDLQILPAAAEGSSTAASLSAELYDSGSKGRVVLANARNDVQYALLAGDASDPDTDGPALPGAAPGGSAWSSDAGGDLVFNGLAPGAYYYLVARPLGYTEVTYAGAAYLDDGVTPAYVRIYIPSSTEAEDIDPADVSRAADNPTTDSITVQTDTGYVYAVYDIATGAFADGVTHAGDGSPLTVAGLDPAKAYQVARRLTAGDTWLRGIRVYPLPEAWTIDYLNATLGSGMAHDPPPSNVEFRIQASDGTWLIGNDNDGGTWRRAMGSAIINLAATDENLLNMLETLGATGMTVSCRTAAGLDGYSGKSVSMPSSLWVPARPDPPEEGAAKDFTRDYSDENFAPAAGRVVAYRNTSGTYVPVDGDLSETWSFEDAGWSGNAEVEFRVQIPAEADVSFASRSAQCTIPKRPPAPELSGAALSGGDIILSGLSPGAYCQFRIVNAPAWDSTQLLVDGGGQATIPSVGSNKYEIRYAATSSDPASFPLEISSPLGVSPVNLGSMVYGSDADGIETPVTVSNLIRTTPSRARRRSK
ncbi:MAG: hypothetical protein LBT26_06630 [Clostridiales Family XIII bacterium]|jgi:hypothetical protein|nr:hypothetical protein [Clostridiales Family XIII bacterium]